MQTVNLCVMGNAYFCPTTWLEQTLKLKQIKYANTSMWGCKLWLDCDCSPISDIRWLILCGERSVASTHLRALCLLPLAYMPSAYTLNIVQTHIGFKLFIFSASLLYVFYFAPSRILFTKLYFSSLFSVISVKLSIGIGRVFEIN